MGAAGAAAGTAISLTVGNIFFMNWYYQTHIGLDMFYFWKNILKFIPSLIVPCISGILIVNFIKMNSVYKMIFGIAIYTVIYCISMWICGMNREEKNMITKPLSKILRRK